MGLEEEQEVVQLGRRGEGRGEAGVRVGGGGAESGAGEEERAGEGRGGVRVGTDGVDGRDGRAGSDGKVCEVSMVGSRLQAGSKVSDWNA